MSLASGVEMLTFGCRLNALESAAIAAVGADVGDVTVVNTCAVTAEAVKQAEQAIRRLGREAPGRRVFVTGCAAQVEPERFAAMPEVERVIGNDAKADAARWLRGDAPRVAVGDIMAVRGMAPLPPPRFERRARASLQVQNGCDHRCTFCVIPFGRGMSRSLPPDAAVAEARRLVEAGYGEIVLTGVDLTAWGLDLADGLRLGDLVRRILTGVPELPRLRLSSVDGIEVDDALLVAFADEDRLMPHLHLSLQAGDDLVLKRMKRRHSRADAIAFCERMRRLRPDVVFGADLIAGFPTEDEAMFAGSLGLVEDCGLTHVHVFPYSVRAGTPAARMPQVAPAAIRERAARLREAGAAALARHCRAQVGRTHRVLAERGGKGYTEGFARVRLHGAAEPGRILAVRVTGTDGSILEAEAA